MIRARTVLLVLASLSACNVFALEGTLLVVNRQQDAGSISFFDLTTEVEIARLPIGPGYPHEVAVSPDGRWALTSEYGRTDPGRRLVVMDVRNARITGYIDLAPDSRPHDLAFLPGSRRAVATMETMDRLALVDIMTMTILGTYPIGEGAREGHMLRLSRDGAKVYVGGRLGEGTLSVVYLDEDRAPTVVPSGRGAEAIAVTADGSEVWVLNQDESTISIVDAQTFQVREKFTSGTQPRRIEALPGGRMIVVNGNQDTASLRIYDGRTRAVLQDIPIAGNGPGGFGFLVRKQTAFLSTRADGRFLIYDLEDPREPRTLTSNHDSPDGMAWSPLRVHVLED